MLNATSSSNISNLKTANTNAQTAASPSILGEFLESRSSTTTVSKVTASP